MEPNVSLKKKTDKNLLRTFEQKFSNIAFFLKILLLKANELVLSEM